MNHGTETFSGDLPPHTLGGDTYVRVNVQTSCVDTEMCVDISVLVFLVIVLSLAILGLIGADKILRWLCCGLCGGNPTRPRQTTEASGIEEGAEEGREGLSGVEPNSSGLPNYEEAINMPEPGTEHFDRCRAGRDAVVTSRPGSR